MSELLTTEELAHLLGYADRSGVFYRITRGGDLKLAACRLPGRHRRCWSRSRLVAAGYLSPAPSPPPAPLCLVPLGTYRIA